MKCPGCGVDVVQQSVYCHKCGARLDNPEEVLSDDADLGLRPATVPLPQNSESHPDALERLKPGGAGERAASSTEENLWEGGYSAKAMAPAWAVSLLATAVFLAVGVWFWSNAIVWWGVLASCLLLWGYQIVVFARRRLGVHYRLTSQRFFHESGILIHTTDLIEVIDMDDITYRQTLIDRFTGVGTIRIVSSDRSHPDLSMPGIEDVARVADLMQSARHAERVRRGLHVEQI